MSTADPGLEFWNSRAELGILAGTNDFMLTEIEHRFILSMVRPGSNVLDLGCGNGMTLIRLAKENGCRGMGIDFSEKMVEVAREAVAREGLSDRLSISHVAVPPIPDQIGKFDYVISQRCFINLKTVDEQKAAVQGVEKLLRSDGVYLMIECSNDGGNATNELRERLGLEPLAAPWHNLFFNNADVQSWQTERFRIKELRHISSTYHFLSRVVYAALAAEKGEELKYDSEINKLSLKLPQETGIFGPVKCWVWKKLMSGLDETQTHLAMSDGQLSVPGAKQ